MIEVQPRNGIVAGVDIVGGLQFTIVQVGHVEERTESVRRHDLGAALLRQQACATEMIGVRVSDYNGMHPVQWDTGIVHARQQGSPRCFPWEPRVDQSKTAVVFKCVRIDVSEAGEIDRELQAQDARYDFHDLRRGVLLLLLPPTGCRWATVLCV
jgi:hypothetical protein